MFGKVRTKTLVIIVAIAIIAMIVIRSCYVCEGFVEGSLTPQEASKHFGTNKMDWFSSEYSYLSSKLHMIPRISEISMSDPMEFDKIFMSIENSATIEDARAKLLEYAKKHNVPEEELGLYSKQDIVNMYAMRAAYGLLVEKDQYGNNAYTKQNEKI